MSTKTPLGSIFSTVPLTMSPARYSLNVFSYWAASDFGFERGVASCLAGGGAWVPFFGKLISVALKSFFALSAGVYSFNKKAGIWFFVVSALIGLARVFAGVHYFSDIVGGLAVGLFSFWVISFLISNFVKKSRTDYSSR